MRKVYYGMAIGLWTVVIHGLNYLAMGGHATMSQVVSTTVAGMITVALLFWADRG